MNKEIKILYDFKNINLEKNINSKLNKKNTKIVFYTCSSEEFFPIPPISDNMFVIGPYLDSSKYNHVCGKIKVPTGPVNFEPLLEIVENNFEPDVLICWVDAYYNGLYNLKKFKGLKVFLPGDTHHMMNPVRVMIDFCKKEKYDFILHSDARSVDLFRNLRNIKHYLLGGITANVKVIPPNAQPLKKILHVGQTGKFHIKRSHYIHNLKKLKLEINDIRVAHNKVFDFYNKYFATLNITLNGDFNARFSYVMAAGGVLISDKLSVKNQQSRIFSDDELLTFSSLNEAYSLIKKLLNDDELRYKIAQKAQKKFLETLSQEVIHEQFWNALNNLKVEKMYDYNINEPNLKRNDTDINIILYQTINECFRISSNTKITTYDLDKQQLKFLKNLGAENIDISNNIINFKHKNFAKSYSLNDVNILVTRNLNFYNLKNELSYDLIINLDEFKQLVPKGYERVGSKNKFNIFKKVNYLKISDLKIGKIPYFHDQNTETYEKSFLKDNYIKKFNFYNKSVLLIGGSKKTYEYLKAYNLFCDQISCDNLANYSYFKTKYKFYDYIILFDDSNQTNELINKLISIYGLMKLSGILIFHSARFIMGAFGWKNDKILQDTGVFVNQHPWEHLFHIFNKLEFKKTSNKNCKTNNTLDVIEKEMVNFLNKKDNKKNMRQVLYNYSFLLEIFQTIGFKIVLKEKVTFPKKYPLTINEINMNLDLNENITINLDPHIMGMIAYVRKANWLEDNIGANDFN